MTKAEWVKALFVFSFLLGGALASCGEGDDTGSYSGNHNSGQSSQWCYSHGGSLSASGACAIRCDYDSDCPSGMNCSAAYRARGTCQVIWCDVDSDCGPGWVCDYNSCLIPCRSTSDCPSGYKCGVYEGEKVSSICIEKEGSSGNGNSSDACSRCLESCRGLPDCCTGCGCLCEDECGGCM